MHNHIKCEHDVKYCEVCDVAYCEKCGKQWHSYTMTYTYPTFTVYQGDGTIISPADVKVKLHNHV